MTTNSYGNSTGTQATQGAQTVVHFYDRAGVKAANRVNLYGQFADRKSMPKKMGKTFKISKFLHMYDRTLDVNGAEFKAKGFLTARTLTEMNAGIDGAALTEGQGAGNKVTLHKVTMETSLNRYGEMLSYSDEVDLFSEDTMQVRYREELGELANSRQEDLLQRDMLGTSTVIYGGDASSNTEIDEDSGISYDLIRKGVRKLVRNRAKKNTSIVTGDVKIGTQPIAKAYYAVIGSNVKGDLETLTRGVGSTEEYAYVAAHKYASAATLADGEVGAMHEVRFIESESAVHYAGVGAEATSSNVGELSYTGTLGTDAKFDAFPILFPTEGSFATVGLKGQGKIKFNSRSPEFVTNENPFGTSGFFSYNFFYAGIILQEEKLLKIMVSASA
jgi:N4-gp56 family major capsid protein